MNQLEKITVINILVDNLGVFIDPYVSLYIHTYHILLKKWNHTVCACLFYKHATVSILMATFNAHSLLFILGL